ncbi:putative glycolipid-binding domain-containing protein [Brevibacillus agri]|uniref:putative glycolipid-binding domain-containing protein n=1 Tax=Brevibacillus agri TaxID=51101 RepID=UPI0018CDC208|nr:putative glycolipid-binding domain-containing protein [Brevibacillus agri]MBG9568371.1 hypothetical protein [Brevibacillus agri]WHX29065.1 putative glycolipid-binding domain-containing protein [Brevibacillus agri]
MLPTYVIWKPSTGAGYEHLAISESEEQLTVDSFVIGESEPDKLARIQYEIVLDRSWATRKVSIRHWGGQKALCLLSDGNGQWTDEAGQPIAELAGCVGIDLSCTPFTNTLPIRRLAFTPNVPQEIDVAYFSAYELTWRRVRQQYTLLASDADTAVFEYRAGAFVQNITVDANGLVLLYPELFVRERPLAASGIEVEAGK